MKNVLLIGILKSRNKFIYSYNSNSVCSNFQIVLENEFVTSNVAADTQEKFIKKSEKSLKLIKFHFNLYKPSNITYV